MAMASDTVMVLKVSGTAPARRTPSLAAIARRSRWMLQGVTSFQDDATPTWGRSKSSSVKPTARSIERAGARSRPAVAAVRGGGAGAAGGVGHQQVRTVGRQ